MRSDEINVRNCICFWAICESNVEITNFSADELLLNSFVKVYLKKPDISINFVVKHLFFSCEFLGYFYWEFTLLIYLFSQKVLTLDYIKQLPNKALDEYFSLLVRNDLKHDLSRLFWFKS